MMKKQIPKILMCCLWLPLFVRAQVAPEVMKKYSAFTVSNVYKIVNRVNLPTKQQVLLAKFFENQQEQATAGLNNKEPAEKINAYYFWSVKDLEQLLTPLQLNDYVAYNPLSSGVSKFQCVIKVREQLALSDTQLAQLLEVENKLKAFKNTAGFNQALYEDNQLFNILEPTQKQNFAAIYAQYKAKQYTNYDWESLCKYRLVKKTDSISVSESLYDYHFKRNNKIEILRLQKEFNAAETAKKRSEANKPFTMYQLDYVRGLLAPSQLNDILKLKAELKLNPVQIDSLVQNTATLKVRKVEFELKNPSKKTEEQPFQNQVIAKTLTQQQLASYIFLKNKNLAQNKAKANWVALREKNLVNEADSASIVKSFFDYELKLQAANSYYQMDKSTANAYRKNSVLSRKPQLLKDLETLTQNTINENKLKAQFSW